MKIEKINNLNKFIYLICSISLLLEFYFNIDSAGSGGFKSDFRTTWPLVEDPLNFSTEFDIKFPLHYYIAGIIYYLVNDKEILRIIFILFSLPIPYLFFLCLKIKFKNIKINNLYLFSLIIFLLPSFRSGAIWPNTQITGIFFFLISIFFFLKWETKKKFTNFNKELFLTILFMSLTVYTRQIYAMIFFYFMIIFYFNLNRKTFIQTFFVVGLFAVPGVLLVLLWPRILEATFIFKLQNSLLVNASILSFYLIPFYSILYFFEKKIKFEKKKFLPLFLITIFVIICSIFFNYNYLMGGGYFIKLSKILFDNFIIFYLTSIVGFFLLYYLSLESKFNLILSLILLFTISAYIIFMKYYEPMFVILLFLIFKTKYTNMFLKNVKNIYFFHLYFLTYLGTAIINSFLLFSKNI